MVTETINIKKFSLVYSKNNNSIYFDSVKWCIDNQLRSYHESGINSIYSIEIYNSDNNITYKSFYKHGSLMYTDEILEKPKNLSNEN